MTGQTSQVFRGTLFVEVRLFDSGIRNGRSFGDKEDVRVRVETWIRRNFTQVKIGTRIPKTQIDASPLSKETDRIEFTGHNRSKDFPDETVYLLNDNHLEVLVYSLYSVETSSENGEDESQDSSIHACQSTLMPHRMFEGLWQTLIYEDPVGELTLRALTRAIQEQRNHAIAWQNTVLFYGPPGSGKTTLAQALAQRLSIRLSTLFQVVKLLQVDSHTLFSRFYGETTKRFGQLFSCVSDMASDHDQLIIVILDEVESVASAREVMAQKNEPGETIRATNELLRGLDRLKSCANVIFFFTSNLVSGLDPAFVDRCCIEKEVNAPATECVFEILRVEINNLIQQGVISFKTLVYRGPRSISADGENGLPSQVADGGPCLCHDSMAPGIPSRQWAAIHWPAPNATTAVSELFRIAQLGKGLSGRKLKGLVTRARYERVVDEPGDLRDLLEALEAVIRDKTGQRRAEAEASKETAKAHGKMSRAEEVEEFLAELEAEGESHHMLD